MVLGASVIGPGLEFGYAYLTVGDEAFHLTPWVTHFTDFGTPQSPKPWLLLEGTTAGWDGQFTGYAWIIATRTEAVGMQVRACVGDWLFVPRTSCPVRGFTGTLAGWVGIGDPLPPPSS